jgi:hypothetical protein
MTNDDSRRIAGCKRSHASKVRLVVPVPCINFVSWSGQSIHCDIAEPTAIKYDAPN